MNSEGQWSKFTLNGVCKAIGTCRLLICWCNTPTFIPAFRYQPGYVNTKAQLLTLNNDYEVLLNVLGERHAILGICVPAGEPGLDTSCALFWLCSTES